MGTPQALLICLCLCASSFYVLVSADEHNHQYNDREEVVAWMNRVGPYRNPNETYAYFSLPFCSGSTSRKSQNHELEFSGYLMEFKTDVQRTLICMAILFEAELKAFTHAVMNDYWYQMYIDGLPIWGKVGERDESDGKYYIYTNRKFDIGYNGQQIVEITLTPNMREELKADAKIRFSYEVNWKASNINFKNRYDKYLDSNRDSMNPNQNRNTTTVPNGATSMNAQEDNGKK